MESDDEVESGYVNVLVIDPQPISLKNDLIGKKNMDFFTIFSRTKEIC